MDVHRVDHLVINAVADQRNRFERPALVGVRKMSGLGKHFARARIDPESSHNEPGTPGRLLILGCSKAKVATEGMIPALQRYDGPPFRVLRRYLSQHQDTRLRVYVLSAEYGLIPSDHPVPDYDRPMTRERAQALRPDVSALLDPLLWRRRLRPLTMEHVLVVMGKDYLSALGNPAEPNVGLLRNCVVGGSQGTKLAVLHDWLFGVPPAVVAPTTNRERPLRFRRTEFALDRDDVLGIARGELPARATAVYAWAVVVDGRRVAPKWLVSQATGVPVSHFTTSEALSLLGRLGIEVGRA